MSFSRHAYCDRCETKIWAHDEDELLDNGWLAVRFGPDDEDDTRDFCGLECLGRWAGSPEALAVVEQVASREEDD